MLPKLASLSRSRPTPDRRTATRRTCTLSFDPNGGRGPKAVIVLDLSRTGMRFWSPAVLSVGDNLDVVVPEMGGVSARIVWKKSDHFEHEYGAEFRNPITEGAISAALLAAPISGVAGLAGEARPTSKPRKLAGRTRLMVLAGLTLASWLVMGAAGYILFRLF